MDANRTWRECDKCGKKLASYKTLWQHKKTCRNSWYVGKMETAGNKAIGHVEESNHQQPKDSQFSTFTFQFSYLMISNIPFYSFKKSSFVKKYAKQMLLFVLLTISLIFIYEEIMLFAVICSYTLGCLIHWILKKN